MRRSRSFCGRKCVRVLQLCIATFASFVDVVWLSAELQRQLFRRVHVVGLHQFLLLSWPRFASGERLFEYWRRGRSDGGPFVELLTEEIGLKSQEDLCTLDFPEVKALRGYFFRVGHHWIDIRPYKVSKCLRRRNYFLQYFLFLRLKGQVRDFSLPILEVFELRASCITRDLDAIIAYWAGVVVIFFDLTTGYFEAFAMVPVANSANTHINEVS